MKFLYKKNKAIVFAFAVIASLALMVNSAVFAEISNKKLETKIGIVNMDIIMQKSIAAKNIRSQVSKKRTEYQDTLKKRESELISFQQGVVKEKDNLKEKELLAKKELFKQKLITAQKNAQGEIRKIDKSVETALKKLRKKSAGIVADVAKEKGFDIVLSHQQVVLAAGSLDITQEVLKRLNKDMKSVPVKW